MSMQSTNSSINYGMSDDRDKFFEDARKEYPTLTPKQSLAVSAYSAAFGNVQLACRTADISRSTWYKWLREDMAFKAAVDELEPKETFLDFLESELVKRIKSGNVAALIFALKCHGQKRGYIERHEIGLSEETVEGVHVVIHQAKHTSE